MDIRAYEKLAEAEFFIDRLASTRGRLPEARYYASAAITSLRSATWVLQADLRSRFGKQFDAWWESRREVLANAGIGFEELRDLRNLVEKRGGPAVAYLTRQDYPEGPISALEFRTDTATNTSGGFAVEFRSGERAKLPVPTEGLSDLEAEERVSRVIDELTDLESKIRSFAPALSKSAPVLGLALDRPFGVAIDGLRGYAAAVGLAIRDAEAALAT